MNVRRVRLENFRNHTISSLEFGAGTNMLVGRNGQGKTNVLEAISCLSLTKSFYAASDATLVQLGRDAFTVEGTLTSDAGIEYSVRVAYAGDSGEKAYSINGARPERLASVIGMFPIVILAPENGAVTFGAPSDRRKFVDVVLSQLSRSYFNDLLGYRQALRQRNRILTEAKEGSRLREDVLEPWNRGLAGYGARIVHKRAQFVQEFKECVVRSYSDLVDLVETPSIRYESIPERDSHEGIEETTERILVELRKRRPEEYRRGLTLVGPHRDDLVFQLNGIDLQKYASQGQHKTFLIALKMAEFHYLKEKRNETPILLLDDVLSELDDERSQQLLSHVAELGQTIVTTTNETSFGNMIHRGKEDRKFHVKQGTCTQVTIGNGQKAAIRA